MFQKCPICNGTGTAQVMFSADTLPVCDVCNGSKMINEITGKPPAKNIDCVSTEFLPEIDTTPIDPEIAKILDEEL